MKIEVESRGIALEKEWPEFVRTTVAFSSWRHAPRVQRVRVSLRPVGPAGSPRLECGLQAICVDGALVETEALGADAFEAVQEASNRLERELFRSVSTAYLGEPQLQAA